jgi:hypothetical protein
MNDVDVVLAGDRNQPFEKREIDALRGRIAREIDDQ